jgi:hypothetical protein
MHSRVCRPETRRRVYLPAPPPRRGTRARLEQALRDQEPADWVCLVLLGGTAFYLLLSESFWNSLPF